MQPEQLKAYEQEIVRARARVEVADLDNEIDDLIKVIIGKLTKAEHERYQASRLAQFMGENPDDIVLRRAALLGLTYEQMATLSAPDVLTMQEMASLVVIMRAIADWLIECRAAGLTGVTLAALITEANDQAAQALTAFNTTYKRKPSLDDLPPSLMQLRRARSIKKLADKNNVLLPPAE